MVLPFIASWVSGAATIAFFIGIAGRSVGQFWGKITVIVLMLVASSVSRAELVEDLYAANVPVPDTSQEALAVASREALSQVLVKVSGRETVLSAAEVGAALAKARSLVQRFAYAREDEDGGSLSAHFEFDSSSILRIIQAAGQPFWTANRPAVLAWVVVEGPEGREFLSEDVAPDLVADFSAEFSRRGIPFQLPLYDIDDAATIAPDSLWNMRTVQLRDASVRYDGRDILAGRLAILSNGDWVGDWAYLYENARIDRSYKVDSAKEFFRQGSALVAQQMSTRFAVVSTDRANSMARVKVSGVSSYDDYSRIVAWLQSLELVDSAIVSSIRGDVVNLNLAARTDARGLSAIIGLNSHLKALPTSGQNEELSYQWLN